MAHNLSDEHTHLKGLRVNDLIAKVARVTLKDTTRVLKALMLVSEFLDLDIYDFLDEDFDTGRPTPEQAKLCNDAFRELEEALLVWDAPVDISDIRAMD